MFDLYFVLPPVIIVVSLALIIFLISRKSLEVEKRFLENDKEKDNKLVVSLKSKTIHLLERVSHWFKVFSLKFHNWNENKLRALKMKKTEVKAAKDKFIEEKKAKKKKIMPDVRKVDIQLSKKEQEEMRERKKEVKRKKREYLEGAMVSKKAVYPDKVRKELEEALIERIAGDPRDIEAYERLGDYYISQNKNQDAEACYGQVLKLNPQNLTVKTKLRRLRK
jgi:tetratricopeptide (TPR) repeat protein